MKPVAPVTKYCMDDLREFLVAAAAFLPNATARHIPHKPARRGRRTGAVDVAAAARLVRHV